MSHGWADAIASVNEIPGRPGEAPHFADADAAKTALPEPARTILPTRSQRVADLRAAIEHSMDERDAAQEQIHELDRALKRLLAPYARDGHQQSEDSPEVQRARSRLDAARERRDRAAAHINTLTARWTPLHSLVERLNRFVIGGGPKQPFVGRLPAPPNGETPAATVQRLRDKIGKLRSDLAAVEVAPLPVDVVLQRAREQIDALALRGRPQVEQLFQRDGRFIELWPQHNMRLDLFGDAGLVDGAIRKLVGFSGGDAPDTLGVVCWLLNSQMHSAVDALIKQSADEKKALSVEQQHQRRADLASELLLIERQEIAAIEHGESQGVTIDIRVESDPRAVLHLS
jgi:hypothetical protein